MMRFAIVKNSGTRQPPQLNYDFSPPGGTIGRSTDNNWVLPDENQVIARLQVIVSITADGECRINNQGSASEVLLNMIPLAPDRQVDIRDGDILNIGDYQIQVIDVKNSSQQQTISQQQPNTSESAIPSEVWNDLERVFAAPDISSSPEQHQTAQELSNNNPLVKGHQHKERNPIDPLAQIEATTSLEALQSQVTDPITMFNSDTTFQQKGILDDHTPTTLLQHDEQHSFQDDGKKEADPLELFSDKNIKTTQQTKNDDLLSQMLDNAVPLNPVSDTIIEEIRQETVNTRVSSSIEDVRKKENDIFPVFAPANSENEYFADQSHINHQANRPTYSNNNGNGTDEHLAVDPGTKHPHAFFNHQTEKEKLEGKLLAALLDGMGLKDIHRLQFDEQNIYQIGLLIRQLTQGIVILNAAHSQLKREANIDIPQILNGTNNPFKILPSGQSVLALMLGGHIPGFMSPEQATRDILTELQAHQLGMIAGVRAIATDILQLFHPTFLEQKAREEGYFSRLSLLSTNKTSMWDYLTRYYQKTAHEFEQHSALFGENFRQAYEAEVNRYKKSQN
ncbi:putative FHA domain protein [Xenorhabdus hominickii]|nr:putative FHA domain protein [Xenorhabdus hominickii]